MSSLYLGFAPFGPKRRGCEVMTTGRGLFQGVDNFFAHFLGVAEQHHYVVAAEELVFDAGVAGGRQALDEEHGLGALDIEDRHAVDRRGAIGLGGRVVTSLAPISKA